MDSLFRFRRFSLHNEKSALKVGTDAVLLGAAMTLKAEDRRALDIGTGTGVIALMAAQRAPQLHIEAIDIDGPSAEEAALNFSESPWPDRLRATRNSTLSSRILPTTTTPCPTPTGGIQPQGTAIPSALRRFSSSRPDGSPKKEDSL